MTTSATSHLEVLVTADSTGQMCNACVWDPSSGSALKSYKGGCSAHSTFTLLGDSFVVSANPDKQLLNVWLVARHEQQPTKITAPGVVSAMAAPPSGRFLAAAVDTETFVWQTCNGALLRVLSGHYQTVTCISFTSDGAYLVTAGADGNVLVWNMIDVVSIRGTSRSNQREKEPPRPFRSWSDHRLSVTGVHVASASGGRARIFTASLDQTSKIYCLASGQLLLDVSFGSPLTSIAVNGGETCVFVGSSSGDIECFSLLSPPRDLKWMKESDPSSTFKGHASAVRCLSVSLDGLMLASGADDEDVRLWHIKSRQCVRVIGLKGKVTLARFIVPPGGMLRPDNFKPNLVFSRLDKMVASGENEYRIDFLTRSRPDDAFKTEARLGEGMHVQEEARGKEVATEDSEEVKRLKEINRKLFEFAANKILNSTQ